MPDFPSFTNENDGLSKEIAELVEAITALPVQSRRDIEPILDRVVQNAKRRRAILLAVQDSLGQLRLDMKYLMFDLEATRRERDECRRQLD